jgi:hypothetical protein
VFEQRAGVAHAALGVLEVGPDRAADLGPGQRDEPHPGIERLGLFVGREALDRVAGADPARIEADQVEAGQHVGRDDLVGHGHHAAAGAARAAGVHEDGSDPVGRIVGGAAGERDRGGAAVRFVVVERHLIGSAVEPGEAFVGTGSPL